MKALARACFRTLSPRGPLAADRERPAGEQGEGDYPTACSRLADASGSATRPCPACGSHRVAPEPGLHRLTAWKIVGCMDCQLRFTDPCPPPEDWDFWYDDTYGPFQTRPKRPRWHTPLRRRLDQWLLRIYRGYREEERPGALRRAIATILAPVLGRMLNPYFLPPHGRCRLLDFGCGTGKYLARMRDLGWTVCGLDRSAWAARRAKELFEVPVEVGTLPSLDKSPAPRGPFDLITAWEVLEHVEDPAATLVALRELLAPGGRLVLTVPNWGGWGARWFGAEWIALDLPRHLTHFDAGSLLRMLTSAGLRTIHHSTVGHSGWWRHSARRGAGQGLGRRLCRAKLLSRLLSALAARRGAGESLFVVAEARS